MDINNYLKYNISLVLKLDIGMTLELPFNYLVQLLIL